MMVVTCFLVRRWYVSLLILVVGVVTSRLLDARGLHSVLSTFGLRLLLVVICGLKKLRPWQEFVGTTFRCVTLSIRLKSGIDFDVSLIRMFEFLVTLYVRLTRLKFATLA